MSKNNGSPHLHALTIKVSPLKESYSLIPFFSASLWSSHRFPSGTCVSKERKSSDSRTFQWAIGRCENVFPTSKAWLDSGRCKGDYRAEGKSHLLQGVWPWLCVHMISSSIKTYYLNHYTEPIQTQKNGELVFFFLGGQRCTWWITG